MFELTRKVLSGTVLAAITGGVLLWGLSPGMTLKREYESYNGKPAGSEHTLQAITVPAYANVQGVTALEACTLQDGILVLAYPTCPYCRNLMPELLDAAEATDTSLYYCTLDKYRDVYTCVDDPGRRRLPGTVGVAGRVYGGLHGHRFRRKCAACW